MGVYTKARAEEKVKNLEEIADDPDMVVEFLEVLRPEDFEHEANYFMLLGSAYMIKGRDMRV